MVHSRQLIQLVLRQHNIEMYLLQLHRQIISLKERTSSKIWEQQSREVSSIQSIIQ